MYAQRTATCFIPCRRKASARDKPKALSPVHVRGANGDPLRKAWAKPIALCQTTPLTAQRNTGGCAKLKTSPRNTPEPALELVRLDLMVAFAINFSDTEPEP